MKSWNILQSFMMMFEGIKFMKSHYDIQNKENEILEALFWESISKLEEKNYPDTASLINWYQNSSYVNEIKLAEFVESYEGEDIYA